MNDRDDEVRTLIARQAADWFMAQREGSLGASERRAFDEWLLASPLHVEEYLGVTAVALALPTAADDPESPLDALLERARRDSERVIVPLEARSSPQWRKPPVVRGRSLAVAASMVVALGAGLMLWRSHSPEPNARTAATAAMTLRTGHGEQLNRKLPDGSVLSLNTDTEVEVRSNARDRLLVLRRGEISVQVAHEPRAFKVRAGVAEITAHGTRFDVRLDPDATTVTVIEGHVAVAPTPGIVQQNGTGQTVELGPNEQLRVSQATWPAAPSVVDAQRTTAWLQRQIVFENEPLASVATEFNRYVSVPFEIEGHALRRLRISGVFGCSDSEAFVAFLRSMKGIRVEVTAASIRVFEAYATPQPSAKSN